MREKGEISVEPHYERKTIKRDIGGTKNGEAVDGTAREFESEGELEIKYGITDNLMLLIELENVFKEREKATLRFGDEIEEEQERESGFSDITFELVYRILEEKESTPMWVAGIGIKPKTASSQEAIEEEFENGELETLGRKGDAGQGNTNVLLRTAISKEFGRFEPFAELKYTFVGDRDIEGGTIEKGDQLQLTLGTDFEVLENLLLRSQFEYLQTGEETKRTGVRVVTDSRDEFTLRGELVWEPIESLEIRPFGGFVWESSFQKKGPDADDNLRFSNNRGWFVGIIVGWHFHLFGE
ncbi:MAG: hypothetical protein V3V56_06390 [bacterium]